MKTPSNTPATEEEPAAADSLSIGEDDVRTALERVLGEDKAYDLWRKACEAAEAPRPGPELGPGEIVDVVEYLQQQPGTASVVGNSLSVKIRTDRHR